VIPKLRLTSKKGVLLSAVAIIVLAACSGTPTTTPTPTEAPIPSPTPTSTPHPPALFIDLDAVPDVDASITSIGLSTVWFDQFDKWALRMTNTSPEVRRDLRDFIEPIYDPIYGDPNALP